MSSILSYLKKVLLFTIPFVLILVTYLVIDPFMVLYSYTDYNKDPYVHKNVDFITTEKFLNNSEKISYDSYIFGGSTSMYVPPNTYQAYLDSCNKVYAFFSSGEHLIGIWSKIKFLDDNGYPIKNALVVIDTEGSFQHFNNDIPMAMKHYEVYPSSQLNFQYKYFIDFVNLRFLIPYTHYRLTKEFHPYMEGTLLSYDYYFDPINNEYFNVGVTNLLETDSLSYYNDRKKAFKPRGENPSPYDEMINDEYEKLILEIKEIFERNHTSYRVLIGPAYHQKALNKADLSILSSILGKENVFDFSGVNHISEQKSNFYDDVHFKKYIGNGMLERIYSLKNP